MIGKNYEVTAIRKDGTEFPVELSLSSWERKDDIFFTAIIRDATQRKKLEQQLRDASLTDELTGLLNRRGFMTLSEKQMQISKRYKRIFAILFLDLNEMKQINDAFGHKAGDQALIDLAGLLKKTFRSSDIIARIGGDEFTVLINEPGSNFEKTITENITNSLQTINDSSDRPYTLSSSLGISFFNPLHPQSIDDLLAEADKRMYEHKSLKFDESHPEPALKQKRKNERIITGNTCIAELIVSDNSLIRNISSSGICLATPHVLKKDNMYNIKIHSDGSKLITLSAIVVWSSSVKKGPVHSSEYFETGMMFTGLDTVRKNTLETFIKSLPV
jgi:diguanylate cyclase (GGDEF)-like protein